MSFATIGVITPETMRKHRATWYVWAGNEKIRHTAKMRGAWGYDATCSCGFETHVGGGTRTYIQSLLDDHRLDAQLGIEEYD